MSIYGEALDASSLDAQPRGEALWTRIRTVVADDVPSMLEAISAGLEFEGLVEIVGRACNGAEALRAVAQFDPELVVMDVNMPEMNGFEAASLMSHWFPRARIMLMSGEESPEIYVQSPACGADVFVAKSAFRHECVSLLGKMFPEGGNSEVRVQNEE